MKFISVVFVFLMLAYSSIGQKLRYEAVDPKVASSFRGLSVVNDKIVWVSGTNGWVGVSTDGTRTWKYHQVKNYDKVDFRSIYAFSATKALVANAGSPASILMTTDAGLTWSEVYRNEAKEAFIDGMDFWNDIEGVVYGDPAGGKLAMLETHNGGFAWKEIADTERPAVSEGEASFAASGTGIRCYPPNRMVIATGGVVSRLLVSNDRGKHWFPRTVPVIQGKSSTGIFSFAFSGSKVVVVGGDYLVDTLRDRHVLYSTDGGKEWKAPAVPTRGYREAVETLDAKTWVAVGPSGLDVSYDGGENWEALSGETGFHVIRKARTGSLVIVAGGKGKIGIIAH